MKLNKFQEEAVSYVDGPCVVTSCPGSGKTRVIVERVIRLIESGVNPQNILCLTFTNKASKEAKRRICKRLGLKDSCSYIGTFHSLCARMLRKIGERGGYQSNYSILDDNDQIDLILKISRQKEIDIKKPQAYEILNALNYFRDQLEDKESMLDKLYSPKFYEIAEDYLNICKEDNLIDFSGLIYETIQIIENNQDIREKFQNIFKYILVDETQDTNVSQYYLVNLLGDKWKNIMLVGDVNQSIYKFRGARYQNIQEFIDKYENCKIISLSKNYRSTPQIVEVADKLIKNNNSHLVTVFETDNKAGQPVTCLAAPDQHQEAQWIANKINQLINEGGWGFKDIAILYRINKMSEPLEQKLSLSGIPYEVIGGKNFYNRKEVKDCLHMLKLLANKKDNIAFHRVASLIKGMGDLTIGRIENYAKEKNIDLVEASKKYMQIVNSVNIKKGCKKICDIYGKKYDETSPSVCLSSLVSSFSYDEYLEKKFESNAEDRKENVSQIIDSSSFFNGQESGISKYLQQVSLVTSNDKETESSKVSLMSLHSSKGLEYPIVFIVGGEQGIIPHSRAVSENPIEGTEEERRLFFVGITRAEKKLYITWCKNRVKLGRFGQSIKQKCRYSQFLLEAGLLKSENY
ncbi:MAG: ATP-dependent helicase [Clostridiales bacterium]|nr:ATP-dependent helicase [Clostridiales bacterium]